ncbi:PVC-type heme-binding CxxCH protein [Salinibacter sp.]|uniref:PVC-type heme-binding CxxCH protein n=1 Tax=Salinibacter sp. TaxID=2065818 RepID=UPI002FC2A92D
MILTSMISTPVSAQQAQQEGPPTDQFPVATHPDTTYLPDGLEATVWAESPQLYNPTNIDVGPEGRVWAVEAVDYRSFNNPPEGRRSRPQGERVVILDDTDGDGRADESTVFVKDEDLVAPLGIAVFGNRVLVSASPKIYLYTDTDGDDKADKREVFLSGFGGLDHDHGVHSISAGPGGRWYFSTGNAGPHIVTDSAGWTLRSSSIYASEEESPPDLVSDDGHVHPGGLMLRIRPDGTGLRVMSDNYRNPYEGMPDSFGDIWMNDNDDDGNASTRVLWGMEGGNYGYFSRDGTRSWDADRRPDQGTFTAHWHQEDPGVLPAGDRTGPGAPSGSEVYESGTLGEEMRGLLLSVDSGKNTVFGYRTSPDGAGFDLDKTSFFSTLPDSTVLDPEAYQNWEVENKARWYRPSDAAIGTDGSIYVADWYDERVGGHAMTDSTGYGRIFRIHPENRELETPEIDLSTTEGQLQALKNPAKNVRYLGFERLEAQGDAVAGEVARLLDAENPYHRARGVWMLANLGPEGEARVEGLLEASNPRIRTAAFRALRQVQDTSMVLEHARALGSDPSPAVRRAVAIFLRDVPLSKSEELMVTLARHYHPGDRFELEAYGLAAEGEEEAVYQLLSSRMDPALPADWSRAWADLVWRLHPPGAVDALRERAASPYVSWDEQKRAMVALGFIDTEAAVEAMTALAAQTDQDRVAERAQWWLDYRRTNEWHDLRDWEAEEQAGPGTEALAEMTGLQEQLLDEQAAAADRTRAAATMAEDPTGGRLLMKLVIEDRLPTVATDSVKAHIFDNPDRTVRTLASRYLVGTSDMVSFSATDVPGTGSAEDGRMAYYQKCASCHRVGQAGQDVGPPLTNAWQMFGRSSMIRALLQPNSGLAHDYLPSMVSTSDGNVLYGFLEAENEENIVLKDPSGREHVIAKERVTDRTQLNVSMMPGPKELGLTEQEVADLVEFLRDRDTTE